MARTDFSTGDQFTAEYVNSLGAEVNGKADQSDIPNVPPAPTADTLSGATTVGKSVMKAADAAAARTAIGAGTSNLAIGTTASTAKAGNYAPAWGDVTGKPTIPDVSGLATQAALDSAIQRIEALEAAAEG